MSMPVYVCMVCTWIDARKMTCTIVKVKNSMLSHSLGRMPALFVYTQIIHATLIRKILWVLE